MSVRFLSAAAKRPRSYLCSLVSVVGWVLFASVLRWSLNRYVGDELPFFLYLPGIIVITAWCGRQAGLASIFLSLVAAWYFWLPPQFTWFKAELSAGLSIVFWGLISMFIAGMVALTQSLMARDAATAEKLAEKSALLEAEAASRLKKASEDAERLERIVAERTKTLEETVAELEAFSYTVSHDLRSPARAMQGFSELLLAEYGERLDEQGRDYLRRIDRSAQRMDALIREVLAYSRIGRVAMETKPVNLEELVADAVHHDAPLKKISAEIKIDRPLASVVGSPAALSQVFRELLTNAAKFVAPGEKPRIKIWTEQRKPKIRVSIQDNGVGVPESALPHVFKPFHRAHPEADYPGTGMGLAIVKRAIERQGGTVGVQSKAGEGSVFWLELPAASSIPDSIAA